LTRQGGAVEGSGSGSGKGDAADEWREVRGACLVVELPPVYLPADATLAQLKADVAQAIRDGHARVS
jgi:hypothetical protein